MIPRLIELFFGKKDCFLLYNTPLDVIFQIKNAR